MNDSSVLSAIRGGTCCLLGFGVSNMMLTDVLFELGAACIRVYDKKTPEQLGAIALSLCERGVEFFCGENYLESLDGDVIIRSPGFRPDRPEIAAAIERGALLTSEMELFMATTKARVIGVTGSDGKTTTTTLTWHLVKAYLKARGYGHAYVGGNIGTPLMPYSAEMTEDDFAIVELSSFQLMTMQRAPACSAITNLSPNHLDWHTGMDEYIVAKSHIYKGISAEVLVTNRDNALCMQLVDASPVPVVLFSSQLHDFESIMQGRAGKAVFIRNGMIVCSDGRSEREMLAVSDIKLPGMHNVENYMTAIALTESLITPEMVGELARSFGGVEHRFEFVREKDGVKFYNSSIDSTPTRTAAALSGIPPRSAWVICGGYDKHIPFAPLAKVLRERALGVVLTGATADKIAAALDECCEGDLDLPILRQDDFADAVRCAAAHAKAGEMVLLSPACASFDAFDNFAHRGRTFCKIVNEL